MKIIFFTMTFLLVFTLKAQIPPILDHVWTIEQIDTGSQIITADLNPNGEYDTFSLNETGVIQNTTFYYLFFGHCEANLSFDNGNSQFYYHLLGCLLNEDESSQIALYFNGIFIQQNTTVDTTFDDVFSISRGPLSYNFSTSEDIIYLHITNSIGEVATFYANDLSQDEFLKESISIYPNPVKDLLQFESSGLAIDRLKIYDLRGRLVIEKESIENQINISQLQHGIYILEIETFVGVLKKKLVKE